MLEKNIPSKWTGKKAGIAMFMSHNRLQTKGHKKRQSYFLILKCRNHQEAINIVNIYAPNIGAPNYMRKILEEFKKDIESNTLIAGLYIIDGSPHHQQCTDLQNKRINKGIVSLKHLLDQI